MKKVNFILAVVLVIILPSLSVAQNSIVLNPVKDNTIYHNNGSSATDSLSNGKGVNFVSGSVNTAYCYRRALIQFDLSGISSSAVIDSVVLKIHAQQNAQQDDSDREFSLHRLRSEWGEGNSNADEGPGKGVQAQTGDATWKWQKYPDNLWTNYGGYFISTASAGTGTLSGKLMGANVYWRSEKSGNTQMKTDVQNWINGTYINYGWIIIGSENNEVRKATMFYSRESANKPTLTVYYH